MFAHLFTTLSTLSLLFAADADSELGQFAIRPIPPEHGSSALTGIEPEPHAAWDKPPHRHTVYLNFDGAQLKSAAKVGVNAAEGTAGCVTGQLEYPAFSGTDEERLAIVEIFKTGVAPFGIRVVHEQRPPKHLPYSQIMIGGKGELLDAEPSSIFTCATDCGDSWWRETGFVFADSYPGEIQVLGDAALKVAGHHWGLDGLAGFNYIMNSFISGLPRTWSDRCVMTETSQPMCASVHDEFCGEGSKMQNDTAELLAMFGPNSVDDVPPTVHLLSPLDGAVLAPGQEFTVEAEVTDNFDGAGWRLMIPEAGQELPAYKRETEWVLTPPKGKYTIRVEALDHDGNVGFDEATIYVGVEPDGETTGDMPDTSTTGGDTGDTTGDTTDDPTGEPTGGFDPTTGSPTSTTGGSGTTSDGDGDGLPEAPDSQDGCACNGSQGAGHGWLGILLLVSLAHRGRRVRRS
ncbi:hypothetical protein SAMN02745121_03486 [Nannocystis exedens]|uniref:MYXO-CTERM domain-containing protein n=1 Tax=Nannocystis exedens TaxID=54 RepID=A0A1I1YRD4_9BACT|nr:hypothetical protein [Nannocystis exedens]PCC70193.1 hypothetical protein NAEX_03226 [Nannocystis exedens]SFE22077.1 hypothetical protein SAMN02745121_03486 [Nannocystis exedens]